MNNRRIQSLLVALLLIIVSLSPMVDNVSAEPGSTNDPDPFSFPEDGVQDDDKDNGTKVKVSNISKVKDKTINLLHNTWSYNTNFTEVQVNVTGDRVQLLITHTDMGNVTLDMNFTYGKGKTFIKTKDKEKVSYKTSDLNLTFSANTSAFKEIIVVEKEKDKLFPFNWTINVTSEMDMDITRTNRTIYVDGIEIFNLQEFTATNVTNGTVALNETYTGGSSSFNISLDLDEVVDKDDYPLNIDPTVFISSVIGDEDNARSIAVNSSGIMYIVYYDGTNVEYQISNNEGKTWGSTTTVAVETVDAKDVIMCIDSNDNLHFFWRNGTSKVKHYKCYWIDNDTWTPRIDFDDGFWGSLVPDDSGNVHLLYGDLNGGAKEELMHRVWDGDSWSAKTQIRNDLNGQGNFRVESAINSTGGLHIVWSGFDSGATWRTYYSNSSDGGSTWEVPLQICDDLGQSIGPSIAIDSSDNLHVIWQGKNATHNQVQATYRKYDQSGESWGAVSYLTDDTDVTHAQTNIAVDKADTIYAIWNDNALGSNYQIVMRKSIDGGSSWDAQIQLIDDTDNTRIPIALHYFNPDNKGIPNIGFMFGYIHDYGGTPERYIYYSSDWALGNLFLIGNEYPTTLGFSDIQPLCHVDVNYTPGSNFNVSFWENSTGSWIKRQENNTVSNGTFWWEYTQASENQHIYYWRVQANDSDITEVVTYSFTTFYLVNETGETITHCDLFSYVDGKIVAKYDMINDTANYTELWPAYRESSGWIADGAGTIILHNDTWYITHRQRTGDTDVGHYMRLDKSTNLVDWSTVWNVTRNDISPVSVDRVERFGIRYYNNSFYLYFGEDHDGTWDANYIKAPTAEELEYSLLNSDNWTLFIDGAKDPEVHYHNGTYYVTTTIGLYRDDNPEFTSPTFIVDFTDMYIDTYGGGPANPGLNTGTIMFDNTSGYFIYWRTVKVDFDDDSNVDDILWFFATSGDLENWEPTDRHIKVKNWTADTAAILGYPAYFVSENETVYATDWKSGTGVRGLYLWVYDKPVSNDDPVFSNETPTNETIGVGLQPWCSIQVNDTDNDTMTINFYENSTGSWVHRQTNNSVVESPDWSNNGTYWWQFTQASDQSTQYWWNVTADDGTINVSATYTFNTNEASTQSDPGPVNETIGISIQPWCDITVNDLEGDSMTVNWYENTTGPYVLRQTNSTASNGTYWWQYTQANAYSTLYFWRVDVLDGEFNTSVIYEFTTDTASTQSDPHPVNETIGVSIQHWCSITVNDLEGDPMTVNWYENSTDVWIIRQTNSSAPNGTYWWQYIQSSEYSTLYYWRVDVLENGFNTSVMYEFTTDTASTQSNPHPANETTGVQLQPWCDITVNDLEGDSMTVNWYENSTDVWIHRQTNATASNGTYWWQYTLADTLSTLYYWRVDVIDDDLNTSVIYEFTTDTASTQSDPYPLNESTGISIQSWCNITVNDLEGDSMTVNWYENSTDVWIFRQANESVSNGTYWWQYIQASDYLTLYFWRVDVLDGDLNTSVIYEFTTGAENRSPEFSEESPTNTTTGIALQPWCHITIEDPEGDTFNVTWYENSTASWVQRQENLTVTNGTFWWQFTQASSYSTTYYWKLVANDTHGNENITIYHFTTLGNTPPVGSFPFPLNGSSGIALTPTCRITASDANGDLMDISWLENTTGPWVERHKDTGVSDGEQTFSFTQFSSYSITYYWRINLTDGTDNVTYIFHFTTNIPPDFSSESPTNGSSGISLQSWCHVQINDTDGNTFDVTWEENSTGSWVVRQQNLTSSNGTFWWRFIQASEYSTSYYWRVSGNDGINNNTTIYHFTTEPNPQPEQSSPSPVNGSSGISLGTWCSITVNDPNGDNFDVNFYENSTGSWVHRQTNGSVSNGTFWWEFTQGSLYSTTYYWNVTADDGVTNVSEIYHFTTRENSFPTISLISPSNDSTAVQSPWCSFIANDDETMNITILENSSGDWVVRQTNISVVDGTKIWWRFTQADEHSTLYYWRVNITDDTLNFSYILHFTTLHNFDIIANFTMVNTGGLYSFTDTSIVNDTTIVSWAWGFGDGSTSTEQNPDHQYTTKGEYTVTLTIIDNETKTNSTSVEIEVTWFTPSEEITYVITPFLEAIFIFLITLLVIIKLVLRPIQRSFGRMSR